MHPLPNPRHAKTPAFRPGCVASFRPKGRGFKPNLNFDKLLKVDAMSDSRYKDPHVASLLGLIKANIDAKPQNVYSTFIAEGTKKIKEGGVVIGFRQSQSDPG